MVALGVPPPLSPPRHETWAADHARPRTRWEQWLPFGVAQAAHGSHSVHKLAAAMPAPWARYAVLAAVAAVVPHLLTSALTFAGIETQPFSLSRSAAPPPASAAPHAPLVYLHVSDIHLSKFRTDRSAKLLRITGEVAHAVKPSFVVASGDLTSAKGPNGATSSQHPEEWKDYSRLVNRSTVPWWDLRGGRGGSGRPRSRLLTSVAVARRQPRRVRRGQHRIRPLPFPQRVLLPGRAAPAGPRRRLRRGPRWCSRARRPIRRHAAARGAPPIQLLWHGAEGGAGRPGCRLGRSVSVPPGSRGRGPPRARARSLRPSGPHILRLALPRRRLQLGIVLCRPLPAAAAGGPRRHGHPLRAPAHPVRRNDAHVRPPRGPERGPARAGGRRHEGLG